MDNRQDINLRFKAAVERNFDESVDLYDRFEEKHHLFEEMTRRLCEMGTLKPSGNVLDVGCGTGISTYAIYRSSSKLKYLYGLDISEAMLERAKSRCKGIKKILFLKGDAEKLSNYYKQTFGSIFYTASIFLIPHYKESLSQAVRLLLPGGSILISFYAGLFDSGQHDAMKIVFPDMIYRYGAVPFGELESCLKAKRNLSTMIVDYNMEVNREFIFDFLSIPAQSAGLFPKISYEERIPRISEICDKLTEKVRPLFMGWKFIIAKKGN